METVKLRICNLPLLRDFIETLLLQASIDSIKGITVKPESPYEVIYEISYSNWRKFAINLAGTLENLASKVLNLRRTPLTVGAGSDAQVLNMAFKSLGFGSTRAERIYEKVADFLSRYGSFLMDLEPEKFNYKFFMGGRVKVYSDGKVLCILIGEKARLTAPSVIRSTLFYEEGRFCGFRDDVTRKGRPRYARVEMRCSPEIWGLILSAVIVSLSRIERIGNTQIHVYTLANLKPGVWKLDQLESLRRIRSEVLQYIDKIGFFIEDYDFLRLILLFHLYEWIKGRVEVFKIPAQLRFVIINPTGRRFTLSAIYEFPLIEVVWLDTALASLFSSKDKCLEIARSIARIGLPIIHLSRTRSIIAETIGVDRLRFLLKRTMYGLTEPNAAPPLLEIYEMLRIMKAVKPQLLGEISRTHVRLENLEEEEARELSKKILKGLEELASTFGGGLDKG